MDIYCTKQVLLHINTPQTLKCPCLVIKRALNHHRTCFIIGPNTHNKGLHNIIEQLNRNFGWRGSALTRVCRYNMFHCCCVPNCSSTFISERHLFFLAHSLKNKTLLKRWVYAIRQTNLPLNCHSQICRKHLSMQREDICTWTKSSPFFWRDHL